MTLSDREKFIAHYLSITIVGMMDRQPEDAVDATVGKLLHTRLRKLSETDVDGIIQDLNDEFLVSGSLLTGLSKMREEERKEWDR